MAKTKFYLDKRNPLPDGSCSLKVAISKDSNTRHITLGIYLKPEEWNNNLHEVVERTNRHLLNHHITERKQEIDAIILRLSKDGKLNSMTATQLKERIEYELTPDYERKKDTSLLFASRFLKFANLHHGRTRELYLATYRHLQKYLDAKLENLSFEDITKDWLLEFDNYLARTSPSRNARNIHLRIIRAVFNNAIDNNITTNYPFRKLSFKAEETAHRTLTVDELRQLFNYPCEEWQQPYVDMYKLIFFLCGINIIDLFNLKTIIKGRVEYHRAKTHKLYSIKVEPEAMEIIKKYKGETALLNMADRYSNYKDYAQRLNNTIRHVGDYVRVGRGGKKVYSPLFPQITTYWMRHTWATIASELDIPDDTISRALGHTQTSGARVTQVYINFNNKKIDEANRRVIDYVLYNKK